ncbi:MAG: hypothetical protein IT497_06335 [Ottowia sp.]|nr:hypothetical protein [Ottowia sp.]
MIYLQTSVTTLGTLFLVALSSHMLRKKYIPISAAANLAALHAVNAQYKLSHPYQASQRRKHCDLKNPPLQFVRHLIHTVVI